MGVPIPPDNQSTPDEVAEYFMENYKDVWQDWVM